MNLLLKLQFEMSEPMTIAIEEDDVKKMFAQNNTSDPIEFIRVDKDLQLVELLCDNEDDILQVIKDRTKYTVSYKPPFDAIYNVSEVNQAIQIDTKNYIVIIRSDVEADDCVIMVKWVDSRKYDLALAHFDDGKYDIDSHEVSLLDKLYDDPLDLSGIIGYGETYDEAFAEFLNEFNQVMYKLTMFQKQLNDKYFDNVEVVETDYAGNPIPKENCTNESDH